MPKPDLTVVVANVFEGNPVKNRAANWLYDTLGDNGVGLLCEGMHHLPTLRARFGPRHVYAGSVGYAPEVPVVFKGGVATRHRSIPVSPFVSQHHSHDRWLTEAFTTTGVAISGHGQTPIQNPRDHDWAEGRAAETWRAQGAPKTEARLRHHTRMGRPWVYGSDYNADANGPDDGPSPKAMFARLGCFSFNAGFMWLAWSGFELRGRVQVLPPIVGANAHRVLVATLRPTGDTR